MEKIEKSSKICLGCGIEKKISFYSYDERNDDGRQSRCKSCVNLFRREWRKCNPELAKEKDKERTRRDGKRRNELKKMRRLANIEQARKKEREYRENNKERLSENRRKLYAKNPDKFKLRSIAQRLGISIALYKETWEKQGGLCAICECKLSGNNQTHFDHDHVNGKPRGLLCNHCNRGLGGFKDNPQFLAAAIEYLKIHAREYVANREAA